MEVSGVMSAYFLYHVGYNRNYGDLANWQPTCKLEHGAMHMHGAPPHMGRRLANVPKRFVL